LAFQYSRRRFHGFVSDFIVEDVFFDICELENVFIHDSHPSESDVRPAGFPHPTK